MKIPGHAGWALLLSLVFSGVWSRSLITGHFSRFALPDPDGAALLRQRLAPDALFAFDLRR
jgi:hypothetical protein